MTPNFLPWTKTVILGANTGILGGGRTVCGNYDFGFRHVDSEATACVNLSLTFTFEEPLNV